MKIEYKNMRDLQKKAPQRATKGSAGADLTACVAQAVVIGPMQSVIIPTGIAISIADEGYVGLVFARSGMAIKYGVALSNGVGVIDSDYTGEIMVGLTNFSEAEYTVNPFDRIAQLLIMPVAAAQFVQADELKPTLRGQGGFGSTGK